MESRRHVGRFSLRSSRVRVAILAVGLLSAGVAWWQTRPPPYETCTTRAVGGSASVDSAEAATGIAVEPYADVQQATSVEFVGDGTVLATTKDGRLERLQPGEQTVLLDVSDRISLGNEQGLLNVVVSEVRSEAYIYLTDPEDDVRVLAFPFSGGQLDVSRERQLLHIEHPTATHNGGSMVVDAEGLLWLGVGDGGAGTGRSLGFAENAQRTDDLLGSILRVDPAPSGAQEYTVPRDNPFVDRPGFRGEIWSIGLRNPWRFSFDRATGDLWIGDVGQDCWEEINWLPAARGAGAGENLGWPAYEGRHRYRTDPPDDHALPVLELGHEAEQVCSIVGGAVYRGAAIPDLRGWYVFGDTCNPTLRALRPVDERWELRALPVRVGGLVSFGEDLAGELYTVSLGEGIDKIVPSA